VNSKRLQKPSAARAFALKLFLPFFLISCSKAADPLKAARTVPSKTKDTLASNPTDALKSTDGANTPSAGATTSTTNEILGRDLLSWQDTESILKDNCAGCHFSGAKAPDLTSLDEIKSKRMTILGILELGTMPPLPKPGVFKVAGQKEIVLRWLREGAEFEPLPKPMEDKSTTQALARFEPQQVSNTFLLSSGYREGYNNTEGIFQDQILTKRGGPLGGIDTNSMRDKQRDDKIQVLLTTRDMAAKAAWSLTGIWKDEDNQGLFKGGCRPVEACRPFIEEVDGSKAEDKKLLVRTWEKNWHAQLENVYYRLYSRPPTESEIALAKSVFIKIFLNEKKTDVADLWEGHLSRRSWSGIIFGLMSSTEFWHY
jgi:hypothetical protein